MTEPDETGQTHEALAEAARTMDRLRSPGGCPWDAEQTHASLATYLLEESHELLEAIEALDAPAGHDAHDEAQERRRRADLREELGDVLLQVLFHARIAQEHPSDPFGIDDVAGDLVAKLTRRHPHVFAGGAAVTPEEVEAQWVRIKAAEKATRTSPLDGIPATLPALARADKVISRLTRAGSGDTWRPYAVGDGVGARLLALVAQARESGVDAEAELRAVLRRIEEDLGSGTEPV